MKLVCSTNLDTAVSKKSVSEPTGRQSVKKMNLAKQKIPAAKGTPKNAENMEQRKDVDSEMTAPTNTVFRMKHQYLLRYKTILI